MNLIRIPIVDGLKILINTEDISCIVERKEKSPVKSFIEIYLMSDTSASFKSYLTLDEFQKELKAENKI